MMKYKYYALVLWTIIILLYYDILMLIDYGYDMIFFYYIMIYYYYIVLWYDNILFCYDIILIAGYLSSMSCSVGGISWKRFQREKKVFVFDWWCQKVYCSDCTL